MEDSKIVKLFFERNELAIELLVQKYGAMLKRIAFTQTGSASDAEECVSDACLAVWNTIPPESPSHLGAFAARITRNISLDRADRENAQKRGGGAIFDELTECIPSREAVEDEVEGGELKEIINSFLSSKDKLSRVCFVKRYYLSESIREISSAVGKSEGSVRTLLYRMRGELRKVLEKEGYKA